MAALDISKSAFANVSTIVVESPAATEGFWRSHAVKHLASMSIATIAASVVIPTGLSMMDMYKDYTAYSKANRQETPQAPQKTMEELLMGFKVTPRMLEVASLYKEAMAKPKDTAAWHALRPNLKMFGLYAGVDDFDPRPLAEKVGMTPKDFTSQKVSDNIKEMEDAFQNVGKSPNYSAVANSLSLAYFKTADKPAGSMCTVFFNVNVAPTHERFRVETGWKDDVVRDFIIRHERTHCLESLDKGDYMVKYLINPTIQVGSMLTEKTRSSMDKSLPLIERAAGGHIDEQNRATVLNSRKALDTLDASRLEGEEISDTVSLLSLIKESRIKVADIEKFALIRQERSQNATSHEHDTTGMLLQVHGALRDNPGLVMKWQRDHKKDLAQGKGLQIGDQVAWALPLWDAHSKARDDVALFGKPESTAPKTAHAVVHEPQASLSQSLAKTAGHFLAIFKKPEEKGATQLRP